MSGGPCSYTAEPDTEPGAGLGGFEKEWMDAAFGRMGAAVATCTKRGSGTAPTVGSPVLHRDAQATGSPEGDNFVFVDVPPGPRRG